MKHRRISLLVLLLIAGVITWKFTRPVPQPDPVSHTTAVDARRGHADPAIESGASVDVADSSPAGSPTPTARDASKPEDPLPDGPAVTKSKQRETVVSSSGKRLVVIDPMATWSDQPPWPEGPKLYAEVDTLTTRYINLRPDDMGEMPRVRAEPGERLDLSISFPEGEVGEKIHVELPNGGSFADSHVRGRVYELPQNHTLSFTFIADEMRGHCNVKLQNQGHTRSLPVWVGELPETASPESGS